MHNPPSSHRRRDDPINAERLLRILTVASGGRGLRPEDLCVLSAEVVGASGACATVQVHDGTAFALTASNATAARIEDLQHTLGEGPGIDARRTGRPIAEPDLEHPRRIRWPVFAPSALEAGAAALFSFPLRQGAVRLGALTFHQADAGALSDAQHADALTMADVVLRAVLAFQAQAGEGELAVELQALGRERAAVHQAAGMVSAQISVGVTEALVRLRARAFRDGMPLDALAADVVARRVRFES